MFSAVCGCSCLLLGVLACRFPPEEKLLEDNDEYIDRPK